jgi:hypothetical protein
MEKRLDACVCTCVCVLRCGTSRDEPRSTEQLGCVAGSVSKSGMGRK